MEVPAQIWNFGALLKFSTSLLSTSPHRTQWSDCVTSQRNSFSMSVTKRGPDQTQQPIRLDFMKTCHPLVLRFINAPFLGSFPISRESRFVPGFGFTRAELSELLSRGPTDCYWLPLMGFILGEMRGIPTPPPPQVLLHHLHKPLHCTAIPSRFHKQNNFLTPTTAWFFVHF